MSTTANFKGLDVKLSIYLSYCKISICKILYRCNRFVKNIVIVIKQVRTHDFIGRFDQVQSHKLVKIRFLDDNSKCLHQIWAKLSIVFISSQNNNNFGQNLFNVKIIVTKKKFINPQIVHLIMLNCFPAILIAKTSFLNCNCKKKSCLFWNLQLSYIIPDIIQISEISSDTNVFEVRTAIDLK